VIVLGLQPIIWLSNGVIQHGFLQWLDLGLAASWIVYLPYLLHQQRQMIRNFERQSTPAIGGQQDDAGTAG
jgi:hypothetical protein